MHKNIAKKLPNNSQILPATLAWKNVFPYTFYFYFVQPWLSEELMAQLFIGCMLDQSPQGSVDFFYVFFFFNW